MKSKISVGNRPRPPRELCSSEYNYELEIVSPSLFSDYFYGSKHSENVDKYFDELQAYFYRIDGRIKEKTND